MTNKENLSDEEIRGLYRPRTVDSRIENALSVSGGVLITGPKWCGKTWTGTYHSKSSFGIYGMNERTIAMTSPEAALAGGRPHLVDEWQEAPVLWDAARNSIDRSTRPGMYIFTGSSVPPEGSMMHSGAGRFARVRMRTMSLFESGDSSGAVSLRSLFETGGTEPTGSSIDYLKAVALICRGGWPGALQTGAASMPESYIDTVAEHDVSHTDGKKRSPETARAVIRSLARNVSTQANMSVVAADMSAEGRDVSVQTARDYVDALKRIYLVDEQEAWTPSLRSRVRVRTSPKRHLADPSLAAAALGAGPEMLAKDVKTAGFLFESMCYRDMSVYAASLGGKVLHFRDETGGEVDQIIELPDGRWGAAEVKLGAFEADKAAKQLLRLKGMAAEGSRDPSFLMVITASGGMAYTRSDGVAVVPLDCLGP
ncbi:MAG: ATP-binding protein [Candidatus Methanoplasma sp.]|jgi:predicted AAA+ superfamily ATPase|nr:ATP-binding protein [Candidatus Methanoplasma sp.]